MGKAKRIPKSTTTQAKPQRPRVDGETWLRQQLAGLELPAAAPDPEESLLRCLAFVHLVRHYGPAERWAAIERFFAALVPDYATPRLFESEAMRWWLEQRFMVQDVLLAQVCRRAGGGTGGAR